MNEEGGWVGGGWVGGEIRIKLFHAPPPSLTTCDVYTWPHPPRNM